MRSIVSLIEPGAGMDIRALGAGKDGSIGGTGRADRMRK
jgi:hypothetical protein